MEVKPRSELKKYFETGDTPSSVEFAHLIDSFINKSDDEISVKNGKIGLGTSEPKNKLDVSGGMVIGADYVGNHESPKNGLLVQGPLSVGTTQSEDTLTVNGGIAFRQSESEESYARLWVEEDHQQCLQFNGSSDYLDLTSHISEFESFNQGTISFWYKPSSNEFQTQTILYYGDAHTNDNLFEISLGSSSEDFDDESLVVRIRSNGETKLRMFLQKGENYFAEDKWHHLVIVLSKNYNKVYVDGESQEMNFQVQDENTSTWFIDALAKEFVNSFVIGKKMVNDTEMSFLNGYLDEMAIWGDRLLSDLEVKELTNFGRSHEFGEKYQKDLTAYWRMGDDSVPFANEQVRDSSRNEYHAQIIGAEIHTTKEGQVRFRDTFGNTFELSHPKLGVNGQPWEHQGKDLYYNTGNVGIGTAEPSEQLHLTGNLRIKNTQIYDNEINRYNNDSLYIGYRNTSNTILQANGGRVGIGMSQPGTTLDVDGPIRSKIFLFHGVSGNSNQPHNHYGIYQEQGGWNHPYPDLILNYHTGIKYVAYYNYNGHRFYTGYAPDGTPTTEAFSIGNGDHNVRVANNLYVKGNIYAEGTVYKSGIFQQEYQLKNIFYSDVRLKEKISTIKDSIDKILKIDGIKFKWKSGFENLGLENTTSYGVLAQDVENVFPELIEEEEGYKMVNYNGLIGVLIEAVKELNMKLETC